LGAYCLADCDKTHIERPGIGVGLPLYRSDIGWRKRGHFWRDNGAST